MGQRSAADFMPDDPQPTLPILAQAAASCRGCDLYQGATQTVFGEGPADAVLMFVGEAPGAVEDRKGRPFVGPAGALFDKVLAEVGLDRQRVYITNIVKHFPSTGTAGQARPRKPVAGEVRACLPWLEAEVRVVQPKMLVCLGATAAQALIDPAFRITRQRGEVVATRWAPWTTAILHPAALLRMPSSARRDAEADFRSDLQRIAEHYHGLGAGGG